MNVTRNVIIDLLPLYLADEASEETRQLVETFLASDPSLTQLAEQARKPEVLEDIPYTLNKEQELKSLEKVKKYTQQRNLFMSMSIMFTSLLLAIRSEGSGIAWFWDGTMAAFPIFVLAIFSWIMFSHSTKKLSIVDKQEIKVQKNAYLGMAVVSSLIFVIMLLFANLESPIGILYFSFFFAFSGWVGYAHSVRQLSILK